MRHVQVYDNSKNVLDAARDRIKFIFDSFENVHLSISGGKDSTTLAHLVLTEAYSRNRRVGVFFLDEELMYQSSIDQVEHIMFDWYPDTVIPMWLQIEYNLTNASSNDRRVIAWEVGKHKLWMRSKKDFAIKGKPWREENEIIIGKASGLDYYSVIENFERCYQSTAFIIGLRATESMNRWRTMCKNPVNVDGKQVFWATNKQVSNVAFYPIFDWNFHDVWKYIYDNNLRYNRVYDWQFKLGVPINEMRVSSLHHAKSFKSIVHLPEFEPKTYQKLVKRMKGVQFAQETGKDSKMFRARKLPKNFNSWIDYRNFLLDTHQKSEDVNIFKKRFSKHLENEYVARQQCRQILCSDIENDLPVINKPDPRQKLIDYYMEVL